MTGAAALVKVLKEQGVEVVFGIPGGVVLTIFDEFHRSDVRVILMRHEQGAAHAADGYARSTGRVGVCVATSGPGATNLVTGLANAYMDSIPVVAVTGQVNTALIGRDSFQEADITGITIPITKHNYLVKNPGDLFRVLREAFYIASTGRPGPVLVDIPVNVSDSNEVEDSGEGVDLRGYKPRLEGHRRQVKLAAEALNGASRPLVYAGGGVITSGAHAAIRELAEKIHAPVTTTLMGKGAFPETHPLSLGMLGMHGTYYANMAVSTADVILAVGARFDDRVTGRTETFATAATIIHVDVDPAEIGKNVRIKIPIVGDAKRVLEALIAELNEARHEDWAAEIEKWKRDRPLRYDAGDGELLPQYVVDKIYEVSEGRAIVTTEVGQNQMWAAQYYKVAEPRTFITSGGLGTMGFGLPAAVGAQIGNPNRLVIDIAGDGSIMMNIQELTTAVYNNLPVKVCVLNNKYLGMVAQWQRLFYGGRYASSHLAGNPDFAKVAEAFGAVGYSVRKKEEVVPALVKAFSNRRTTVIDFHVRSEENVMPMVPRGGSLKDMITEPPEKES
ncbi:MAG: biosynthetic-type acetolactate synthase large subunit [bacterium]